MTGILLCCAALIVALTALYVIACREDLAVKAWNGCKAFVQWMREPAAMRSPYALDPVDEHFTSSPRVVAGSDIDRQLAIRRVQTDAAFDALVAAQLADLDTHLSAYYVLPEGNA